MALSITERMATGWFLTINNAERKKLTVFEVRCSHGGCLLAAVVTIDKELYIPGVTDSTKTETHPTALRDVPPEAMLRMLGIDYQPRHPEALPGRLTAEALREMTVNEFLTGFSGAPRGFSMADVAAVDPVRPGTGGSMSGRRLRLFAFGAGTLKAGCRRACSPWTRRLFGQIELSSSSRLSSVPPACCAEDWTSWPPSTHLERGVRVANQFEPYVDLKTAAEYLGVSEKTVRRMILDEKSPARYGTYQDRST